MLRVHRQLRSALRNAEVALALAEKGRQAIEASIAFVHEQLDVVCSGCVDFDMEDVMIKTELALLNNLRQLETFEREVAQPAEELYRDAAARMNAFEDQLAEKRAENPSGIRTRPVKFERIVATGDVTPLA